jgi:predicted oxidoreductase
MAADVPALGLGTATVMRLHDRGDQVRLIQHAWDLGFRHFDTAPLYGFGQAERVLGRALSGVTEPHTLFTKVGILPSRLLQPVVHVQGPARRLLMTSPRARHLAHKFGGRSARPSSLSPEAIARSVDGSLRRLGRDTVEGLLLHDRAPADVDDAAVAALCAQQQCGRARLLGAAGDPAVVTEVLSLLPPGSVAQTPMSDSHPPRMVQGPLVEYGALGNRLGPIWRRLQRDENLTRRITQTCELSFTTLEDTAASLLRLRLSTTCAGLVLVGSSSPTHLDALWRAHHEESRAPTPVHLARTALGLLREAAGDDPVGPTGGNA